MRIVIVILLAAVLGWLAGPFVGERVLSRILERQAVTDGWAVNYHLGAYEGRWLLRSMVARVGLGALVPEEALYFRTSVDADGALFSGANAYTLRFAADDIPPADAFWSLTVYHTDTLQLVENPIQRYQLGDRTPGLLYAEDGSLTIYLSRAEPAQGPANWLPTPEGDFDVLLRAYEPSQAMLDGTWMPPAVTRGAE